MNRVRLAKGEDERNIITFVGRPFPLSEAHEHLARLRRWGLTFGARKEHQRELSKRLTPSSPLPCHMGSS